MTRRLGYYVHHRGAGHAVRAQAIVRALQSPATLLSELPLVPLRHDAEVVHLPPDCDDESSSHDPTARSALHWAPLQPTLLGPRTLRAVEWLARPDVAGLVCDVSVEMALLARLTGVRTVTVRMHGRRDDAAHRLGADVTHAFLAPYPAVLEDPTTSDDVRVRTFYSGFPRSGRPPVERDAARARLGLGPGPLVLVAVGAGGHSLSERALGALDADARRMAATVAVIGPVDPLPSLRNVRIDGWVDDPWLHLCAADVVVGSAGRGVTGAVTELRRPFVVVPQPRPFGEQDAIAERLAACGAAVALPDWPSVGDGGPSWATAIEAARALDDSAWDAVDGPDGAAVAARWLERTFELAERVAT